MKKTFFKNVLPAMLAFAFSGVYAIVDGYFVGQNVGDTGLASINIGYPITALIQAVGTGIGMGGAVNIAFSRGRGERENEKGYLGNTIFLLAFASVCLTMILWIFHEPLLKSFGAKGEILKGAKEYIGVIILGAACQIISTGLLPVLRNYGAVILAMVYMMAGFMTNVVLDYLFVSAWQQGLAGAAWATIIGQAVTMVPCILFVLKKEIRVSVSNLLPVKKYLSKIGETGISPLGLTLSPNIVILIINRFAVDYGGAIAVTVYAVISYVLAVLQLLLQGIGDGVQPLMSLYAGSGNWKAMKGMRRLAYSFAFAVTVVCAGAVIMLSGKIPGFFGASQEAGNMIVNIIPIFMGGIIFSSFLRITIAGFYATGNNKAAYFLIYGEPFLLLGLLKFVLPPAAGLEGVWMSQPASQIILMIISMILMVKNSRRISC